MWKFLVFFAFLSTALSQTCLEIDLTSPDYYPSLDHSIQNLRFVEPTVSKPRAIVFPTSTSQVAAAVVCANTLGYVPIVRSNGHSYEGYSASFDVPFIVIDLSKLNKISVHPSGNRAEVEAGATLGELYYAVATATNGTRGFSAGSCPTVGAGGHISGGGFGLLSRRYGLAADNVLDVEFVSYDGTVHTKETLPDDVYWALRGGGGGSFGIVTKWTLHLVPVPPVVTVFTKPVTGLQDVLGNVSRWQHVAPYAPRKLYLSTYIAGEGHSSNRSERRFPVPFDDIQAIFHGQYLGRASEALQLVDHIFPELGLNVTDVKELSWIESVLYFSGLEGNITVLNDRNNPSKGHFKAKSDYVQTPIDTVGLLKILKRLARHPEAYVLFDPYGGRLWDIPAGELPFPHRAGNLFSIQYQVVWSNPEDDFFHIDQLRRLYKVNEPYVSSNPRSAYVNYLDSDLGVQRNGTSNATFAGTWGHSYFGDNWDRLVSAKAQIDPGNYFRNPQSIQLL